MTPSDLDLLLYVHDNPRALAADIARALGVAVPVVRPLIAALRSRGLLAAEGRTRGVRYTLTSAGVADLGAR